MDKKAKFLGNGRHSDGRNQGILTRSSSFSGRFSALRGEPFDKISDPKSKKATLMRRPKTQPELLKRDKPAFERTPWLNLETPLMFGEKVFPVESADNKSSVKLLVNVTVAQSSGALRVLVSDDATVMEMIKAALAQYVKEWRRPILSKDPLSFALHYSQFTIDCLHPDDKLKNLGSRNFFLCVKKQSIESVGNCGDYRE